MKKAMLAALLLGMSSFCLGALPKVAVLDIIPQPGIDSSAVVPITESIMEEVVGVRAYVVLDRAYIEKVLKEQEFQLSTMVSDSQVAQAGQYLGADYVVAGKVQLLGDTYFLVAKMIEVRTGIIVAQSTEQGDGKLSVLLGMAHAIGRKLVAGAPVSPLAPVVAAAAPTPAAAGGRRIKAGFVMPFPRQDENIAENQAIERVRARYGGEWLDLAVADRVAPEACAAALDRLVEADQCRIIFSTDWGFAEAFARAARRHPGVVFESLGGEWREDQDPNLGIMELDDGGQTYLMGLVAGSLSATGRIGWLSEPVEGPWVFHQANRFALGVRAANPKASVLVRFLPPRFWTVPGSQAAGARELIGQGCDFVCGVDSGEVWEALDASTRAGRRVRMFQRDLSYRVSPNVIVSGPMRDWTVYFEKHLLALRDGAWKKELARIPSASRFGGGETPFNPAFLAELRAERVKTPDLGEVGLLELIERRAAQMESGEFEPFTGPVRDQKGKVRLPAGVRADWRFLEGMDWLVDGVKGSVPGR